MKRFLMILILVAGTLSATNVFAQTDSTEVSTSWITAVTDWYSAHMNYGSIVALMTIESSFIPFPVCVTDNYIVNVSLIVLFGTIGALLGAIINYLLSLWLGRAIIYAFADSKLGHLCLLSREKVEKAEAYFNDHGKVSTFVGRFIPGIRQLISIPAGLSKMHFGWFLFYTFLGAALWNTVLAILGYVAHGQADLINEYSHEISVAILVLLGAVVLYYLIRWMIKRVKA